MRIRVIPWGPDDARVVGLDKQFELRGPVVTSSVTYDAQTRKRASTSDASPKKKRVAFQAVTQNSTDDDLAGFKTLSGTNAAPSKESQASAGKCFDTDEADENDVFVGFKTLSGKRVAPSKDSQARADKLFDAVEADENDTFVGFKTLSRTKVAPSNERQAKADGLSGKVATNQDDDFEGFKTLSGKSMVASSESRAKADRLFEMSDLTPLQQGAEVPPLLEDTKTSSPLHAGTLKLSSRTLSSHTTPKSIDTPSTSTVRRRRRPVMTSLSGSKTIARRSSASIRESSLSYSAPPRASAYRPLIVRNSTTQRKDSNQTNPVTPMLSITTKTPAHTPATPKITPATPNRATTSRPVLTVSAPASSLLWSVTASNADGVRFDAATGLPSDIVADSKALPSVSVLSVDYTALHLISTRKLDPALVRKNKQGKCDDIAWRAWVRNHYRWIVWKLASIERTSGCVRLTYDNVVEQLARRFRREFESAEKPAFRAILQRDAPSQRLVVVCVSEISSPRSIRITDGWYSLDAVLDDGLSYRVSKGSIRLGTKLATCGARLDGEAIDPLDLLVEGDKGQAAHALRLDYNGTRLARRDAKLGFQRQGCMIVPLRSVVVGQGSVPAFDAVVSRIVLPSSSPSENEVDATKDSSESEGGSHLAIRVVAPGGKRLRHVGANPPPVFAHLAPRTLELVEGDCALREGDLLRISSCDPWKTRADGTLGMRMTRKTRISRLASPASRNLAAAAWYVPRSLAGCDVVAAHLRDPQRSDNCVDIAALVVEARQDSLVVADASPYLVVIALSTDHEDSRRARALKGGDSIALLNLVVRRFIDRDDFLACDLTSETRVCATPAKLDDATSGHSTSRLRDEFESFQRWSRGRAAARAIAEARAQLQLYDAVISKNNAPSTSLSLSSSSTVSASVLATLRSRSDAGATLAELASELRSSRTSCAATSTSKVVGSDEGHEDNKSREANSSLDAVIQEMQGNGLVYLDSDRVYLL